MKVRRSRLILILSAFALLLSSTFQPARAIDGFSQGIGSEDGLRLLASSPEGIGLQLQVPWQNIQQELITDSGTTYTNLTLPAWERMSQPGAPTLPYKLVTFGVPFGAEISVSVKMGKSRMLQLDAPFLPAVSQEVLPEILLDPNEINLPQVQTFTLMDKAVYSRAVNFPGELALITNDGVMRAQRLAAVAIYPLQYNPVSNTLTIYEELWIEIRFSGENSNQTALAEQDDSVFADLLADTLINYDQARFWQKPDSAASIASAASPNWDVPNPAWKLTVVEEGFYELSRAELQAAGFPVDTPENIQMFNLGQEIALDVRLDSFGDLESIVFYGQAIESKYTDQNIYWLTVGDQAGLRIGQRSGAPAGADVPQSYPRALSFEPNTFYLANTPGENDMERFFWTYIYAPGIPSLVHTFLLENQPYFGDGSISVDIFGGNYYNQYPDHHVAFYLNEVYLGETWFDGRTWQHVQLSVPAGVLQSGNNTVRLTCPNDTGTGLDLVYVDRIQLDIPNTFIAEDGELTFNYPTPGSWLFEVNGLEEGAQVRAFDITNETQPVEIVGGVIELGVLSFQDTLTTAATYRIQKTDSYLVAPSILAGTPSSLKSTSNGADFIVISHADFLTAAETLAAYRQSPDLRALTVDLQDTYDEFNYGIISPYAIRDFLAYTQGNWQGSAPAYVLLVGDGHYDPKNNLGFGRMSYLPPFLGMFDPNAGETSADNRYVTFDGLEDQLPDMMIGRLSVNTLAEAQAMVNKVIAYEALVPDQEAWQRQVLFVADDVPLFANTSEYMAVNYVEARDFTATRVYQSVAPHETLEQARAAIQAELNAGKLFVNYTGHATYTQWADGGPTPQTRGLLNAYDIALLENDGMPPIVLGMTCSEGYFIRPNLSSINLTYEALAEVFTRKPVGGALASWSASGSSVVTGHFSLNAGFYEAYFNDGVGTLGEATTAGKLALWATGYALDLMDTYHLFGDPAIVFKRGLTAVSNDYELDENATLVVSAAEGVLSNEINPDNLPLEAVLVPESGPTNGTLEFNSDGSFSYTPNANWYGLDRFSYRAVSGETQSNAALVNLFVLSTNQAPVGVADSYPMNEDTALIILAENGVLKNDTDGDGESLTAQLYSGTARGTLQFQVDGSFNYYPYSNVNGTDSFTYRAYDGESYSEITTVTINITAVNDAPYAYMDSYTAIEARTLVVESPGVLSNDFDPDGDGLTAVYVDASGPLSGALTLNADGSFSYTPNAGFIGEDHFSYKASDGELESLEVLVTILVEANTPPEAFPDNYTAIEARTLVVESPGVLSNDFDPDGDGLTAVYVVASGPSNGALTLDADGSFNYTSVAGYSGSDTFSYRAYDGGLYSVPAEVTISVEALSFIYLPLILK